jgi:hypothetical protein
VVHTGVVYEVTQAGVKRPVPNLRLLAWEGTSRVGASPLPDITTDAAGGFSVSGLRRRAGVVYVETAPGAPVKFICPSHPLRLNPVAGGDLYVVDALWSGDDPPTLAAPTHGGVGVSGRVTERAGEEVRPVAGASVVLDDGVPSATTNATGYYAVCSGMGADFVVTLTVSKDG